LPPPYDPAARTGILVLGPAPGTAKDLMNDALTQERGGRISGAGVPSLNRGFQSEFVRARRSNRPQAAYRGSVCRSYASPRTLRRVRCDRGKALRCRRPTVAHSGSSTGAMAGPPSPRLPLRSRFPNTGGGVSYSQIPFGTLKTGPLSKSSISNDEARPERRPFFSPMSSLVGSDNSERPVERGWRIIGIFILLIAGGAAVHRHQIALVQRFASQAQLRIENRAPERLAHHPRLLSGRQAESSAHASTPG